MNSSPTIITSVPKECELCKFHPLNGTSGIKESLPASAQQLKPKMPDYLELLSTIDDSRFTVMDGKEHVRVGTRLMYDSLVRHFGH